MQVEASKKNIQIQKWVAILSVGLLVIKIVAYYLTHSVAILTDALEGIVNIVAGFVGLYSLYIAAKPQDEDHPYGHGKVEFVSAALEGSLILVAGLFIIYNAVNNLIYPEQLHQLDIGMGLICITAVLNFLMGILCIRVGRQNNSIALKASGKHLQSDTYTTLGITGGLIVVYFTKILWIDSVVAIVFALLIMRTGYKILRSSLAGIMDETDRDLLVKLVGLLNSNRNWNWIDLHNLRIIKYGNQLHMDCHLTVPWYLNVNEAHLEIDKLTGLVRNRFGSSVEFFIHTDGCLEASCPICDKSDCPVRQHALVRKIEWTVENISENKKHSLNNPAH
ncbi:cation diffusion facilitator family transporter [Ohtaekwangia koreensis]|uniref:Cation diffusion facilitator family transporter n=1 Tax=Ohtaekwangia koreensis TaxID=688867 RepID=A0A1T5K2I4_9BACT|nr:cation diffusion facilitator family transporter [Ohtaekwangia koreensis]